MSRVDLLGRRVLRSPSSLCNLFTAIRPGSSSLGSILEAIGFKKVKSSLSIPELIILSHFLWNLSYSVSPVSSEAPCALAYLLISLTISLTKLLDELSSALRLSLSYCLRALYWSSTASSIDLMPPGPRPMSS